MSDAAPSSGEGPPTAHEPKADLRELLTALVKVALVGPQGGAAPWHAEAIAAQRRVSASAGAIAMLSLDDLWTASVARAERDPAVRRDETVNPTLPTTAPLRLDQLCADPFSLATAVKAIRDAASFG